MNVPDKPLNPLVVIRDYLDQRKSEIAAALPRNIAAERFIRVVLTAIQQNPELLDCSRPSLWNACMRSAHDGLYPDGREAAMVIRRDKNGVKFVNYQVMVGGYRKKVRASDEIATWDVTCIYSQDEFDYELGDSPFIRHRPFFGAERGQLLGAYSIATLKTGEKSREVMSIGEIRQIRDRYSDSWKAFKAKKIRSTPWADAEDEMARKTVARRHSKVLPMSPAIEEILKREDEIDEPQEIKRTPRLSQNALLERFANGGDERLQEETEAQLQEEADQALAEGEKPKPPDVASAAEAFELGQKAHAKNAGRTQWPGLWRDQANIEAWRGGWDQAEEESKGGAGTEA